MPVIPRATPVDYDCKCHGGLYVGIGFSGVHCVVTGAAGVSVVGVTDVVDLAAGMAGKGVMLHHL